MAMDLRRDRPLIFLLILSSTARQQGTRRQKLKCRKAGAYREETPSNLYLELTMTQRHAGTAFPRKHFDRRNTPLKLKISSLRSDSPGCWRPLRPLAVDSVKERGVPEPQRVPVKETSLNFADFTINKSKESKPNLGFCQVEHDFCAYESHCSSSCF